jgi:meso-butanediol dehydrogenase / (S,S)-butanediol dehydrogenase / diacetyl reductase
VPDVAVVTGASRGIGEATARRLASDGYRVVAAARSAAELDRLAAQTAGVTPCVVDMANAHDVARLAATADGIGPLDVWVNNAATLVPTPFAMLDLERWRETMSVDLDGVFLGCHHAYRRMAERGDGVIVNVASLSGVANVEKFPGLAAYNVAKAGVIALSEAVALEGRARGVRCMCLSPGAVATTMLSTANPRLRTEMQPDHVADIVAFLVRPEASWLSGSNIPIFSNA